LKGQKFSSKNRLKGSYIDNVAGFFVSIKNYSKYSIIQNAGRFKTLQAISIALMYLIFQFHACFHMPQSFVGSIVRPEIRRKKLARKGSYMS